MYVYITREMFTSSCSIFPMGFFMWILKPLLTFSYLGYMTFPFLFDLTVFSEHTRKGPQGSHSHCSSAPNDKKFDLGSHSTAQRLACVTVIQWVRFMAYNLEMFLNSLCLWGKGKWYATWLWIVIKNSALNKLYLV